jgi:hypothetical protein
MTTSDATLLAVRPGRIRRLVLTNRVRTIGWSTRGVLAVMMLVAAAS